MINISFNFDLLFPLVITMGIAAICGFLLYILGRVGSGLGELALGVAESVAGGRTARGARPSNKGLVAVRAVLYLGLCIAAFVAVLSGYTFVAYLVGAPASAAFVIAVCRLLRS